MTRCAIAVVALALMQGGCLSEQGWPRLSDPLPPVAGKVAEPGPVATAMQPPPPVPPLAQETGLAVLMPEVTRLLSDLRFGLPEDRLAAHSRLTRLSDKARRLGMIAQAADNRAALAVSADALAFVAATRAKLARSGA